MQVENTIEVYITPKSVSVDSKYQFSDVEYIIGAVHTQRFFFYKNHEQTVDFMSTEKLIDGLQKTVEQYPMVAGRLVCVGNDDYEIHSLGKGVPYKESHCEKDISAFNQNWPESNIPLEWQAVPWGEGADLPVAIHVTRFANNSGLVMCVSGSHLVSDGSGWTMFIKAWATFTRGEIPLPPNHNRQLLRLDSKLRHLLKTPLPDLANKQYERIAGISRRPILLKFKPESLARLKQQAMDSLSDDERSAGWFSTLDVVTALIWRTTVKIRQLPADEILGMQSLTNMRSKLKNFPNNFFGNSVDGSILVMAASDILNSSLGTIALANRQVLKVVDQMTAEEWILWGNSDNARSIISRGLEQKDIDFLTTDWSKFGYYTEMNFGNDNPVCYRRYAYPNVKLSTIMEGSLCSKTGKREILVSFMVEDSWYESFINHEDIVSYATELF